MASTLDLTTGIVYLKGGTNIVLGPLSIAGVSGTISLAGTTGGINLGPAGFIGQLSPNGGYIYFPGDGQFRFDNFATTAGIGLDVTTNGTLKLRNRTFTAATGALDMGGKVSAYNGVTTAGWGLASIVAAGRVTAQAAANASIATYTVGAADGSFEVSANMNVTASTTLATTLTCTYTDEANVARTMILPIAPLSGTFTAAGAITGAGASVWHTPIMHIRCKASTAITILTSAGTFTGVTYTAEGIIAQKA